MEYFIAVACLSPLPPRRKSFEIWRATPGASLRFNLRHVLLRPDWLTARAPSAGGGAGGASAGGALRSAPQVEVSSLQCRNTLKLLL